MHLFTWQIFHGTAYGSGITLAPGDPVRVREKRPCFGGACLPQGEPHSELADK